MNSLALKQKKYVNYLDKYLKNAVNYLIMFVGVLLK
jgi:hypothetical protein